MLGRIYRLVQSTRGTVEPHIIRAYTEYYTELPLFGFLTFTCL